MRVLADPQANLEAIVDQVDAAALEIRDGRLLVGKAFTTFATVLRMRRSMQPRLFFVLPPPETLKNGPTAIPPIVCRSWKSVGTMFSISSSSPPSSADRICCDMTSIPKNFTVSGKVSQKSGD